MEMADREASIIMTQKDKDKSIKFNKDLRVRIDGLQTELEGEFSRHASAERTLAKRALQQARHWLGEDLHLLGNATPYPNGIDPNSLIVDPKADTAQANVTQVPADASGQPNPTGYAPVAAPPTTPYPSDIPVPTREEVKDPNYPSTTPVVVADGRSREEAGQEEVAAPSGHRIISGGSSR